MKKVSIRKFTPEINSNNLIPSSSDAFAVCEDEVWFLFLLSGLCSPREK